MKLRVVSWNVHSWRDSLLRNRSDEIVTILIGLNPDVIFLQEARWDPDLRIYTEEFTILRTELELSGFALAQTHLSPLRKQATGLAILFRGEVSNKKEYEIGSFFGMKRKALFVEGLVEGRRINLATAHISPFPMPWMTFLDWQWLPRKREAKKLWEISKAFETPLIFGVDLNAPPDTEEYRRFRETFNEAEKFPATHTSGLCVDYIFSSRDTQISHVPVELTTSPSDHYPVVAEVSW